MPKFSIIAPVYKVEKYIPSFMNCVFQQTYTNFEIILVDDGSPDRSGSLCDAYAARDNRVKVIHKENGGVSSARNVGVEAASGDWILFFDPDDTFPSYTLQTLDDVISIHPEVELVLFNYTQVWHNGNRQERNHNIPTACAFDKDGISRHMMASVVSGFNVLRAPWTKAYRRSVLLYTGVKFTERTFAEDYQFNLSLFPKLKRAIAIPDCLYEYWVHYGSAISRYHKGILDVWKEDTIVELNFYEMNKSYVDNNSFETYLQYLFSSYCYALLSVYNNDTGRDKKIIDSINSDVVQTVSNEVSKRGINTHYKNVLNAILKKDIVGIKRALWMMNIKITIKNKLSHIKSHIKIR